MHLKHLSFILIALTVSVLTQAQKLPNIQEASLRAPSNVMIDGKAQEWNNQFQAYNHAADIFYTISNDDNKLYLIIQAIDHTVINKILGGGIIFTVNTSGEKNLSNGARLTYPILDLHNRIWVNLPDQPDNTNQADSIMNVKNKDFANKSKIIGVKGVKGLDTILSIYNRDGIKAAGTFNSKLYFTYELSIDLKLLGLAIGNPAKFAYNIRLPGVNMQAVYAASGQATTVTSAGYVLANGILPGFTEEYVRTNQPSFPHKVHMVDFMNPTNFWGEYILKK